MKQHIKLSKTQVNKGVLDFSFVLDAPAGKHGFLQIKDDHFYFEDGTRARFLGFNIAASRQQMISVIMQQMNRGKSTSQIADFLDMDVAEVQRVCDVGKKYAPDYDLDAIYKELYSQEV